MIKNLLGGLFGKVVENAEGILDEIKLKENPMKK